MKIKPIQKRYQGDRHGKSAGSAGFDSAANVMDDFRIDFLSPVDRPAQEGAVVVLMKRHGDTAPTPTAPEMIFRKDGTPGVITSATNGHTHIVWLYGRIGETSYGSTPDSEHSHDHPWKLEDDATITIGENESHTHTVTASDVTAALVAKGGDIHKEIDMDAKELKALNDRLEKAEQRAEAAEKRGELQLILTGMSDSQRTHFDALDEVAKAAFASKSSTERDGELATIAKAKTDADPILYTTDGGTVIRKSDGDIVLALAKRADAADKRAEAAEARNSTDELRKRAQEELAHLPGTEDEHVALLKAVDTIPEGPARDQAIKTLTAGNEAMKAGFTRNGASAATIVDDGSADSKLDALVKRRQEANPGESFAKAYAGVMETPEGREIYAKAVRQ